MVLKTPLFTTFSQSPHETPLQKSPFRAQKKSKKRPYLIFNVPPFPTPVPRRYDQFWASHNAKLCPVYRSVFSQNFGFFSAPEGLDFWPVSAITEKCQK